MITQEYARSIYEGIAIFGLKNSPYLLTYPLLQPLQRTVQEA